jgi:hypothetical protein
VEDFYNDAVEANVEAARQLEPAIELAELAGNVLTQADAAADFDAQHSSIVSQAQEFAEQYEPIWRQAALAVTEFRAAQLAYGRSAMQEIQVLNAQWEPFVKTANLGIISTMQSAWDEWRAASIKTLGASIEPIVKTVNLRFAESSLLAAGQMHAQMEEIASYAQTALADLIAELNAFAEAYSVVGVGAVPKPSLSGAGEVVLPGENAWPAVAEQLQRIGALPCGHIYAIVLALVLFAFLPKLRDDIGDIALFVTIANVIIRSGKR